MKKLTFILMAFVLIVSACKKDDETEEPEALNPTAAQKGFTIEYTSTTCPTCGGTGGPLLHKYADDAPEGAIIALHVNGNHDPMCNNSLSYGFSDRPSGGGIPSFWVGDTKTSDENAMKTLLASGDAVVGVDLKFNVADGKMTVETLTKFFSSATGDYYLSVYIIENGVDGSSNAPEGYVQPGTTYSYPNDDYKHDFIMRACTAGNVYGELLVNNPEKDKEFSKTYTITVDADWKRNLQAIAVIWKLDNNATPSHVYVNSIRR